MSLTHRKDHKPFTHHIGKAELSLVLDDRGGTSAIRMDVSRIPGREGPLVLNGGESICLRSILVDGVPLQHEKCVRNKNGDLVLDGLPDACLLEIHSLIGRSFDGFGLVRSPDGALYTQCEREGFRNIAFFPDRPDVSAEFTVRLSANAQMFPALLSNGIPVSDEVDGQGMKTAVWHDPVRKPAYLFAIVAGNLHKSSVAEYETRSGRKVAVSIWQGPAGRINTGYAMRQALASLRWQETEHGLEYDLPVLNIVAIRHFAFGGMENKGLIIMKPELMDASVSPTMRKRIRENCERHSLGRPWEARMQRQAGRDALEEINRVLPHEIFHNWTGNRVTVTTWFDAVLKESLTTFMEREFRAHDMGRTLERIELARRFAETCAETRGKPYLPLVPQSYTNPIDVIRGLYSYTKAGAIIDMMKTLMGEGTFKPALSSFLAEKDGTHAGMEDFMRHMEKAANRDFTRFRTWLTEKGHPVVKLSGRWNEAEQTYTLKVSQKGTETPRHFPLVMGLLAPDGREFSLNLAGETGQGAFSRILEITKAEEEFVFTGISARPTLSPFRSFSAPVECSLLKDCGLSIDDFRNLIANDTDNYNRWRAAEAYATCLEVPCIRTKEEERHRKKPRKRGPINAFFRPDPPSSPSGS